MTQNENNGAFLQLKIKAEHVFLKKTAPKIKPPMPEQSSESW